MKISSMDIDKIMNLVEYRYVLAFFIIEVVEYGYNKGIFYK